ncbi:hypothetical protein THASP1DRAFT_21424 [Thamnocephalis sphaerospora]|uniref:Pentacotripeptide-repeat region of PRORP domain-containing protein n=1 Tax=Thamnocephalis sphaerospora TaxID=78915 RepID=A0A4P9XX43_9FUNG|nr:hypothetical protein THASP1DRAFT_21424 [Thamnocephalis sphaerospora]|eukprot:RKP10925.1 hypothetical protein THASP1DRAFT_21424 [Thamnocephalis sphaerospora]
MRTAPLPVLRRCASLRRYSQRGSWWAEPTGRRASTLQPATAENAHGYERASTTAPKDRPQVPNHEAIISTHSAGASTAAQEDGTSSVTVAPEPKTPRLTSTAHRVMPKSAASTLPTAGDVEYTGSARRRSRAKVQFQSSSEAKYVATSAATATRHKPTKRVIGTAPRVPAPATAMAAIGSLVPFGRRPVQRTPDGRVDPRDIEPHRALACALEQALASMTACSDRQSINEAWLRYERMRHITGFLYAIDAHVFRRLLWMLTQRHDERRPGSMLYTETLCVEKARKERPAEDVVAWRDQQANRILMVIKDMRVRGLRPPFLAYRALMRDALWLTHAGRADWCYMEHDPLLRKALLLAHLTIFQQKRMAYHVALRDATTAALMAASRRVMRPGLRSRGVQVSPLVIQRALRRSRQDTIKDVHHRIAESQAVQASVSYAALLKAAQDSRQRALGMLVYNDMCRAGMPPEPHAERQFWSTVADRPSPRQDISLFAGMRRAIWCRVYEPHVPKPTADQLSSSQQQQRIQDHSHRTSWNATHRLLELDNLAVAMKLFASLDRDGIRLPVHLANQLIAQLCETGQLHAALRILGRLCGVSTRALMITGRRLTGAQNRPLTSRSSLPAGPRGRRTQSPVIPPPDLVVKERIPRWMHVSNRKNRATASLGPDATSFDTIANAYIDRGYMHLAMMVLRLSAHFGQGVTGIAGANIRLKLDLLQRWRRRWTIGPVPMLRLWRADTIRPMGSTVTMAELALDAWLARCQAAAKDKMRDDVREASPTTVVRQEHEAVPAPTTAETMLATKDHPANSIPPSLIWPDVTSYNLCLATLLIGDPDARVTAAAAARLLQRMRAHNVAPNVVTYNILLQLHARRRDLPACLRVLESMKTYRILPTTHTHATVAKYADPRWWRRRRHSSPSDASNLGSATTAAAAAMVPIHAQARRRQQQQR